MPIHGPSPGRASPRRSGVFVGVLRRPADRRWLRPVAVDVDCQPHGPGSALAVDRVREVPLTGQLMHATTRQTKPLADLRPIDQTAGGGDDAPRGVGDRTPMFGPPRVRADGFGF